MPKPIITEHNSSTGEYIRREMTDYEWEQTQIVEQRDKDLALKQKTEQEAKEAILQRLGLTAEEAKLLLS